VIVSTTEDVATGGLLVLALANPVVAVGIAVLLATGAVAALLMLRRLLRRMTGKARRTAPPPPIN
jgi:hypothetical protein